LKHRSGSPTSLPNADDTLTRIGGAVRSTNEAAPREKETEMRRVRSQSHGQIAVVVTLALAVLVGVIGLGADMGILYFNWVRLQKAADASALAAANYFLPNPPPPPSAPAGCTSWGSSSTDPKQVACTYATFNRALASEVSAVNVPALNPPASVGTNQTIQVVLRDTNVPVYFLKLVGVSKFTVAVQATAMAPSPLNGVHNGLFPAGMPPQPNNSPIAYGAQISLTDDYSPGNWGWLDIPIGFQGSTSPGSATHGGGANLLETNIQNGCVCDVSVGDWLYPKPGESWGKVRSAVGTRATGATLPSTLTGSEPQLVTVPVIDWSTSNGASSPVKILGFAEVWLVGISKQGSNQQLTVQFVQFVSQYGSSSGGPTDFGGYMYPLLVR
jgi:Putative Flp pilus-assembly TadE/G-like